VYGVIRDTSPEAWTPALGYAAKMISLVTIVFFALVILIFWLGGLGEKRKAPGSATPASPMAHGTTPGD
jgi:hypothetical protein